MSSVPTCLFSMFSVSDWKQQVGVFHTCASSQYVQQQEQGWSLRLPHPQVVLDTRQRASSGKLLLGGCETFHVLRGNIKAADTSESSESSGLSLMRQCNGKQASPCRSPPGPWASSPQTGFPPRRTETPGSLSGWTEGWRTALDSSPPDAGPSGGDRGTPRVPGWKSGRGRRPESLNSRNQLTPNHVTNLTQLLHHQEMLKFSVYEQLFTKCLRTALFCRNEDDRMKVTPSSRLLSEEEPGPALPGSGWGWSRWPAALKPLRGRSGSCCGTSPAGPGASRLPVWEGTRITGSQTGWGSARLWAGPHQRAAAGCGSRSDSESPVSSACRSQEGDTLRTHRRTHLDVNLHLYLTVTSTKMGATFIDNISQTWIQMWWIIIIIN